MNNINLLGNRKKVELPFAPKIRLMRRIAIVLLVSISSLSIILFLLISFSPLPGLQQEEQQAVSTLSQSHTDIAKFLLVKDRLQASSLIVKDRLPYAQKFKILMEKMPAGITIRDIEIEKKSISLTVLSGSLTPLDLFLEQLVTLASEKKDFSDATLVSLITDVQQGVYLMTIRMTIL